MLLAFDIPVTGFPSEYCYNIWCVKTKMVKKFDYSVYV